MLTASGVDRLRQALAEYTSDGITRRFGAELIDALRARDRAEVMRLTAEPSHLSTLIRVFWWGATEPAERTAAALAPLTLAEAFAAGLLTEHASGVRACAQLTPYQKWWLLADFPPNLRPGPLAADHVVGVGEAPRQLIEAISREPVGTALDLGCGGGVQSLHLSEHAKQVTATDISPRALRLAAITNALNGLDWELLQGDLFAPVAGRRFDLVVSNPPYILGTGEATYLYRDSGRPGDAVCAQIAAAAPDVLTEGGLMQFNASWAHVAGQPWQERVAGWIKGTGCDAWILEKSLLQPQSYVDMWLRDAGQENSSRRRDEWLDWFRRERIESIGTGLISIKSTSSAAPIVHCEVLAHETEQPIGEQVRPWFDTQQRWRANERRSLDLRYAASPGLKLRQEARLHGPHDWRVDEQFLTLAGGMRWSLKATQSIVATVAACDGTLPLREQVAKLAIAHDLHPEELLADVAPHLEHLVRQGFLRQV